MASFLSYIYNGGITIFNTATLSLHAAIYTEFLFAHKMFIQCSIQFIFYNDYGQQTLWCREEIFAMFNLILKYTISTIYYDNQHMHVMLFIILPSNVVTLFYVGFCQAKQVYCFSRYQFHISLEHNCTHKTVTMHTAVCLLYSHNYC